MNCQIRQVLDSDKRANLDVVMVELKDDAEVSGVRISKGFWLEHMFIEPRRIGKGIGTKMFDPLRKIKHPFICN